MKIVLYFIIRFILILVLFPFIWLIYGVIIYIRYLFSFDGLNIEVSFTEYLEEFRF